MNKKLDRRVMAFEKIMNFFPTKKIYNSIIIKNNNKSD